jgi:hypothetical protein
MMVTSHNALEIKVPFNPMVPTETVSRRARFRKMRHHDSPQRTAGRGAARTVDDGLILRLSP